jgi:CheY-like chemotaxis protein
LAPSAPKVLIVDAKRSVRALIRDEIHQRHPDYEVREANDGFTAGEQVGAWKPDVVILDLRMPGMDGMEVCSQIRTREETRNTAVIAITAYYSPKAARQILKHGARACLEKPLKSGVLLAELDAALGG